MSIHGHAAFSGSARLEQAARALFGDCLSAFHAFAELPELAENLRILSLNAELAAGRAGDKGRAVRALTQYTRELVNRLNQIQEEMASLQTVTYAESIATLRQFQYVRLFDRSSEIMRRDPGEMTDHGLFTLERSRTKCTRSLSRTLAAMSQNVDTLRARARTVAEVVSQSDSIATNIAIEAAAAGVHEKEFRTVADTMRSYVEDLRQMIDRANQSVNDATNKSRALQAISVSTSTARFAPS